MEEYFAQVTAVTKKADKQDKPGSQEGKSPKEAQDTPSMALGKI